MKLRLLVRILALIAVASVVSYAQNNKQRESELRTVRGTVVDKEESLVDSAVIYLKNIHSQDIITHLSSIDGTFRFSGLDINVDYEIHAEKEGMTSSTHSISNFDTRKEFVLTLKLDRKKSGK